MNYVTLHTTLLNYKMFGKYPVGWWISYGYVVINLLTLGLINLLPLILTFEADDWRYLILGLAIWPGFIYMKIHKPT